MRIDDNSVNLIITFLESGDEKALNTFINLSLYPDEDKNEDFSELIDTIKALPFKDLRSIKTILKPFKKSLYTLEYLDNINKNDADNEELDIDKGQEDNSDPIDNVLVEIQNAKYLDTSEKNILKSFYDNNLMDNCTRLLSKKIYFHILKTAQLKFHLFH